MQALERLGIDKVDGILLDLGVSSPQLDDGQRGFSYMHGRAAGYAHGRQDAPGRPSRCVNTWSYEELQAHPVSITARSALRRQIAAAICRRREQAPIETTLELVDVIKSAMPASALREKQHPAKRSFQAIRIAVNDELGAVETVMKEAVPLLNPGGRLAVITFHSLEDRIVKNAMAEAGEGLHLPAQLPGVRLRQEAPGADRDPQAHCFRGRRAGTESQSAQREAADL